MPINPSEGLKLLYAFDKFGYSWCTNADQPVRGIETVLMLNHPYVKVVCTNADQPVRGIETIMCRYTSME